MNAKTKAAIIRHGENLLKLFPHATERDPVKLCKRLRRLEREGAAVGLRLCNGPEFPGGYDEADAIEAKIFEKLDALLNWVDAGIPVIVNRDPRGYALKIDDTYMRAMQDAHGDSISPWMALHRDLGGYGIIAPDLTEK